MKIAWNSIVFKYDKSNGISRKVVKFDEVRIKELDLPC